ncbi:LysE family transporter [Reichenbachiella sp. MALMAid0571]|uniref:LysE family transporter n=1 Tax=Reichenbachiella sp. MALMAid0571 TaxID=3143939 RepID=UPI0032E00ABC
MLLLPFFIGLLFSFLGSIPPGTINITTVQYAVSNKKQAALSFAMAAALTEFLYAGIAVRFQMFLSESSPISENFQLVSGIVLIALGIINLTRQKLPGTKPEIGEKRNAFKKGILISLANPMAIPFWLAMTAYLQSIGWLYLSNNSYFIYLAGISSGTFLLLIFLVQLGSRFSFIRTNKFILYRIPGITFMCMGIYTFFQ